MLSRWRHANLQERANFVLLALLVAACAAFGGGSRADVLSLPIVYLVSVLLAAAGVMQGGQGLASVRVPLILLALFALCISVQVIPLPPGLWRALPGRTPLLPGLDAVNLGQLWRPLSLTPDLTLYALVGLLPALAVLLVAPRAGRLIPAIVPLVLVACAASALVGLFQAAGTLGSFYLVTNVGVPVGLFANRNHQAAMLVTALPLLAAWASTAQEDARGGPVKPCMAAASGAALFPLLLVTGSRAGIVFALAAALAGLVVYFRSMPRGSGYTWGFGIRIIAAGAALVVLPTAAAFFMARDVAFQRLATSGSEGEMRTQFLDLYGKIARDFLPFGSGFGSFDAVFRWYEPLSALSPNYLNHAHNELAELLIEGGLPAILIALGFAVWIALRSTRVWRTSRAREQTVVGRAASVILIVLLTWSLVDYPLRTPTFAALAGIACVLLVSGEGQRPASRLGKKSSLV